MTLKRYVNFLIYKVLPLKTWLKLTYYYYHKKKLNIANPQLFSEKLYIMKMWNMQLYLELIKKCYDKFTVRDYVENTVGKKYLSNIYGLWDDSSLIDFTKLPKACVFKITQSSGFNIICFNTDGSEEKIKRTLNQYLSNQNNLKKTEIDYKIENYYFNQKAKIMCEELLINDGKVPNDMRFLCFSGKVQYIVVDFDTVSNKGEKLHEYFRNVYDINGNYLPYRFGRMNNPKYHFPIINNLSEMIEVAEKLARPFRFVRVDLYNLDGRIVFGELTWIPQGGVGKIYPLDFDKELGHKLDFSGYDDDIFDSLIV